VSPYATSTRAALLVSVPPHERGPAASHARPRTCHLTGVTLCHLTRAASLVSVPPHECGPAASHARPCTCHLTGVTPYRRTGVKPCRHTGVCAASHVLPHTCVGGIHVKLAGGPSAPLAPCKQRALQTACPAKSVPCEQRPLQAVCVACTHRALLAVLDCPPLCMPGGPRAEPGPTRFGRVSVCNGSATSRGGFGGKGIMRERSHSAMRMHTGSGTVFDYWVDMKSKGFPGFLRQWWEVIPPFQYNKELPYFQMLVPTMDTVRCARWIRCPRSVTVTISHRHDQSLSRLVTVTIRCPRWTQSGAQRVGSTVRCAAGGAQHPGLVHWPPTSTNLGMVWHLRSARPRASVHNLAHVR